MIPIPKFISSELRSHILQLCAKGEAGWEFANQEEDALTADFFGTLRTDWITTNNYQWRFHYNKVRGRGPGAMEKTIGADGIITLHYKDQDTNKDYHKSLVFQAKKESNRVDNVQWDKMKSFFPRGNMIVSFGPSGYSAYQNDLSAQRGLCEIIANDFLECKIGIEGLFYDHVSNKFVRPNKIPLKGTVKNELMIEVFKNPK